MRLFVTILLMISSLFFNTIAQAQTGTLPFHDPNEKITVQIPITWETKPRYSGTLVMALSPLDNAQDTFRDNINIVVEVLQNPLTATQFFEANLKAMQKYVKDYQLLEQKAVMISGLPAIQIIASHQIGNAQQGYTPVKVTAYFLTHKQKGYVITGTSTPQHFHQYFSIFESLAQSFKLGLK